MTAEPQHLYAVIKQIRTCFNQLKGIADEMGRDIGINASMRAVLEALDADGACTVPDIARAKGVSRQHIQINMDALLAKGLAESRENPAHKRSPLFLPSAKGRKIFAQIRRREAAILERLASSIQGDPLPSVERFLEQFNEQLTSERRKDRTHELD